MIQAIANSCGVQPAQSEKPEIENLSKALASAHKQAQTLEKVTKIILSFLAIGLLVLGTIAWNPLLLLAGAATYIFSDALSTFVLRQLTNNLQEIKAKT